ncbi:MAG: hypothetical protein ABEH78_03375 [Haloferacaceae archaeon]
MTDAEASRLAEWADLTGASLPGDVRDRDREWEQDRGRDWNRAEAPDADG